MALYKNRIVVKVGTSTLTNELGYNNLKIFDRIAGVLSDIHNLGYEVILVSSGAIAVGYNKLSLKIPTKELNFKQAAAAVGQCSMMFLYDKYFAEYDKSIAQILLNNDDIKIEEKKQNLINTFDTLLELGIIPIVNENDSVGYTEIQSEERIFGDNDMLSAVVATLCGANKLIILSDIDGLYDKDPRKDTTAKLIKRVEKIQDHYALMAGGAGSRRGTGGMITKLAAAKLATSAGIETIITNGNQPDAIYRILNNEPIGTVFQPKQYE